MNCEEARPLLDAYFDSELDFTASLRVEQHLAQCPECAGVLRNLGHLRAKLKPEVWNAYGKPDLGAVRAAVRHATHAPGGEWPWWTRNWLPAMAAVFALAILIPWGLNRGPSAEREIVDSHVRSLLAQHLVDVPSTDRHTVKPWFQGKLDFSPDVPDLSTRGFELVGGRLDVFDGHPAAALIYRRGGHLINLWTARSASGDAPPTFSTMDGYQVAHWTTAAMERWAVSDINRDDLAKFVDAARSH